MSAEAFAPWPPRAAAPPPPDFAHIEQTTRAAAHAQGYADGYAAGQAAAREEQAAHGARIETLLRALGEPLSGLDAALEEPMLALVLALTREVVRAELALSPRLVAGLVGEALRALPPGPDSARIELHPDDARLLRATLSDAPLPCTVAENPAITRGGCRVHAGVTTVDATVEARIAALAAGLLGREAP